MIETRGARLARTPTLDAISIFDFYGSGGFFMFRDDYTICYSNWTYYLRSCHPFLSRAGSLCHVR
jgi:hypothetical protein